MSSGSPSQIVHDVGGPTRGSPSSRQTGTPSSLPWRSWSAASSAALAACSPGTSASRAPISSSANGSSPSSAPCSLDERERGLGRLVVALDRRGLAAADVRAVPQLDLDDVLPVARLARDHERLGQPQADDSGVDLHDVTLSATAPSLKGVTSVARELRYPECGHERLPAKARTDPARTAGIRPHEPGRCHGMAPPDDR